MTERATESSSLLRRALDQVQAAAAQLADVGVGQARSLRDAAGLARELAALSAAATDALEALASELERVRPLADQQAQLGGSTADLAAAAGRLAPPEETVNAPATGDPW